MAGAPGPVQPTLSMNHPLSVSTAGVHPLVKASMLGHAKAIKPFTPKNRAKAMSTSLGPKNNMSRVEMKSRRGEVGRQPRG